MNSSDVWSIYPKSLEEDNIRLLQVKQVHANPHHQSDGTKLECHLHQFRFDDSCPEYTALSYTWGSPIDGKGSELFEGDSNVIKILLLSTSSGAPVTTSVGRNLHDALRAFHQKSGHDAYIWVDAVCINQEDAQEKSVHVARLDRVYTRAAQVHVWMGEPDPDSTYEAIIYLSTIVYNALPTDGTGAMRAEGNELALESPTTARLSQEGPLVTTKHLNSLSLFLMQRKVFHRMWIFQELILSPETYLIIHSAQIRPCHLMRILHYLTGCMRLQHPLFNPSLVDMQRWSHRRVRSWHYFNYLLRGIEEIKRDHLLCFARNPPELLTYTERYWSTLLKLSEVGKFLGASDPRDHIYSLLGLIRRAHPSVGAPALIPDYSKSPAEIYRSNTVAMLRHLDFAKIVPHYGDFPTRQSKGLPSWVIDLSARSLFNHNAIAPERAWNLPWDQVCPESKPKAQCDGKELDFQINGNELSLKGHRCDRLKVIYHWMGKPRPPSLEYVLSLDAIRESSSPPDLLERLRVMLEVYSTLEPPCVYNEPAIQVVANLANIERYGKDKTADELTKSFLASVREDLATCIAGVDLDGAGIQQPVTPAARSKARRVLELLEELDGSGGLPTATEVLEMARSKAAAAASSSERLLRPPTPILDWTEFGHQDPDRYFYSVEMFITDHGFAGRCFPWTRPGDEIWMLPSLNGCPVALRPTGKEGRYKLLNRIYVHGGLHDGYLKRGLQESLTTITLV